MASLLEPVVIGDKLTLRNRVGMSSMTRNRCVDEYMPGPSHVQYYADRARYGTGIIMTEGVLVDRAGLIFPHAPFLFSEEHAEAWQKVVDAVHEEGGKIFLQAWHPGMYLSSFQQRRSIQTNCLHVGRVQNEQMPAMKDSGCSVLAPSAIKADGGHYRDLPGAPVRGLLITTST